ncbi:MAG: hypothetical protein M2R45_01237 [Verrucomicrobia subdivision 3 bacterium]|nr:hypothetical protein [Limisphaerales bacterium]MCS1415211.1 hypothetical protein [Limisphaerales bacterium]
MIKSAVYDFHRLIMEEDSKNFLSKKARVFKEELSHIIASK